MMIQNMGEKITWLQEEYENSSRQLKLVQAENKSTNP